MFNKLRIKIILFLSKKVSTFDIVDIIQKLSDQRHLTISKEKPDSEIEWIGFSRDNRMPMWGSIGEHGGAKEQGEIMWVTEKQR